MAPELQTKKQSADRLQELLHFAPDDVALNLKGTLSQRQSDHLLEREILAPMRWSLLMMIASWTFSVALRILQGGSLLDALTAFARPLSLFAQRAATEDRLPPGGVLVDGPISLLIRCAPYLLVAYAIYRLPWNRILDVIGKRVDFVEGRIAVLMRGVNDQGSDLASEYREASGMPGFNESFEDWSDAQSDYSIRIQSVAFRVPKAVIEAIDEGHPYRAYFTPNAKRLVALVPKVLVPGA